ncbi:MAG TPA: trypsin-like peptidase domain-containing protein [Gemmatimonadaceae bacterium]|nr:trypsin-like peptidase domain-containing protein [Gemmatimonadaceae bacterium]
MTATSTSRSDSPLAALSDALAAAVEDAGRATVAIHARQRIPSSGVVWRPGVVVAAHHTIRREDGITVTLDGGRRALPAQLAGRDPSTDLAVLTVAGADAAASLGDSDTLRVGHLVLAVGRPGDDVTATLGTVSATGGPWRTWAGGAVDRMLRLDLAIYDGFSGGPLVDAGGRVVGVNTSGLVRGGAVALPVATVSRVVEQILATGRVARGYLGLGMQPVRFPEALARSLGLDGDVGVIVLSVEPGGPGDAGGVLVGDVLVSLGGAAARDTSDVLAALGPDTVGKPLAARVVRAGALRDLTLTVGERPRAGGGGHHGHGGR